MPQRDRAAGSPFGHGRAVNADPVGQVLLRPAEINELAIDPTADCGSRSSPALLSAARSPRR